ncbi:EAL domain, c-di-GMP-specific phosphodiesterase class I (or its enzymatically inactive variant) [Pseudovibrio denitrificans]|uniref:EAL domain, c-di-GMP-specific phosphodiesterase class I (Or its enzymatically inactive variant) n=1 Tax=Pseudovibrio denitrificans TaxID=258256 RepID=A0A1I6XUI0_9HYPH|nr:EAL domain-containing protein [Pseudovibrio denitrificans]SFT42119.1 EAL domain, c-di-GMP-specific phosphodiesterase class I (or its enzymatically inactive variant) [Pseudovibrio denitrificans]
MSRHYFVFVRAILVALGLALLPLLIGNMILENFAMHQARNEMNAIADRYISRSEAAISDVVEVLRQMQVKGLTSCTRQNQGEFEKTLSENVIINAIGIVDHRGVPMCYVPAQVRRGSSILPALKPDAPRVGIGMSWMEYQGIRTALVSWKLRNGWRLVANISPTVLAIEPGPDYLRHASEIEVRLGRDHVWVNPANSNLPVIMGSNFIEEFAASTIYPINVRIRSDRNAVMSLVGELKIVAVIACSGIAIFLIALGVWLSWKPEKDAEDDFVASIRNNEFIPYYQPVVDIVTGELQGCEMLMRWQLPNGKMVPPGQFMTYAETSGHIFEMTRSIMRQSIDDLGELYSKHPELKLSVNLFAGHFNDRSIVDDLLDIYEDSPIALNQVVMEVTERQPLEDIDLARKIIAELQAHGIRVALDDVGTGHGGLAYLQKLGMDIVKIDKMFIDPLGSEENAFRLVDAIAELADTMNMGIIAEGVEKYEQIVLLRELGVSSAQGYIFSKPPPARKYLEFAEDIFTDRRNPVKVLEEKKEASDAALEQVASQDSTN